MSRISLSSSLIPAASHMTAAPSKPVQENKKAPTSSSLRLNAVALGVLLISAIGSSLWLGRSLLQKNQPDGIPSDALQPVCNSGGQLILKHGVFKGSFTNDRLPSWGVYTYNDGSKYEGFLENFCSQNETFSGRGVWTTPDGLTYNGDFSKIQFKEGGNPSITGLGQLTISADDRIDTCSDRYEETLFQEGKIVKGTPVPVNGDVVLIEFKEDGCFSKIKYRQRKCGIKTFEGMMDPDDFWQPRKGVWTFTNGDKYEGEVLNEQFYGQGNYTQSDGERIFIDTERASVKVKVKNDKKTSIVCDVSSFLQDPNVKRIILNMNGDGVKFIRKFYIYFHKQNKEKGIFDLEETLFNKDAMSRFVEASKDL